MSPTRSNGLRASKHRSEEGEGHSTAAARESGGLPWGLLVTGLVVAGLGYLAWSYVEPDLRRYLKIRNM